MSFRVDVRVSRIEVVRLFPDDQSDDPEEHSSTTEWSVTAIQSEDEKRGFSVGFLEGSHRELYGRVLVEGYLMPTGTETPRLSREDLILEVRERASEPMYDLARRALAVQAGLFDSTFEFPIQAPEAEIEFVDSDPETTTDSGDA